LGEDAAITCVYFPRWSSVKARSCVCSSHHLIATLGTLETIFYACYI